MSQSNIGLTTDNKLLVIRFRLVKQEAMGANPFEEGEFSPLPVIVRIVKEVISARFSNVREESFVHGIELADADADANANANGELNIFIFFPTIIISKDPLYNMILNEICQYLNNVKPITTGMYGNVNWNRDVVSFDYEPPTIPEFEECHQHGVEGVSRTMIRSAACQSATQNNISLDMDRFDLLLGHFTRIHEDGDKDFFRKYVKFVASAYYKYSHAMSYTDRVEEHSGIEQWLSISSRFGIDAELASEMYHAGEGGTYSILAMESILKRKSTAIAEKIRRHNDDKFRYMIASMIKNKTLRTPNQMWRAFIEFIRIDHTYINNKLYVLHGSYCKAIEANYLRPLMNRFCRHVHETKALVLSEASQQGTTYDPKRLDDAVQEITRKFEGETSERFVLSACRSYLAADNTREIRKIVAFRDVVVEYDQDMLLKRGAFMEDHMFDQPEVTLMGFDPHKNANERQAIDDVYETFRRMFGDEDNVQWFIRLLGSGFLFQPRRIILVLYGPKGGNAKTTIVNQLRKVLQGKVGCFEPTLLEAAKPSGHTDMQMKLMGNMFNFVSEPEINQTYSSSTCKKLSGADPFTGSEKNKGTLTFVQTGVLAVLCNHLPTFDKIDQALLDRLYVLRCPGCFSVKADPDPEVQRRQQVYPIEENFWNDIRLRALAHVIVFHGFPQFKEKGLERTLCQRRELDAWSASSDPYIRFTLTAKTKYNGKEWYTKADDMYSIFSARNPRFSSQLTYEKFKVDFGKSTQLYVEEVKGEEYYHVYHPDCHNRYEAALLGKENTTDVS